MTAGISQQTWQRTEVWTGVIAVLPGIELELTDPIARAGAGVRASIAITVDAVLEALMVEH